LVRGTDIVLCESAFPAGSREKRLLIIYRTRLLLFLEDRFADIAQGITAFLEDSSVDGRTLCLAAQVMENHTRGTTSVSYAKLVSRVYREAIKRVEDAGGDAVLLTSIFHTMVTYSVMKCSAFQAERDVSDFVAFLTRRARAEPPPPEEAVANLAAAIWNESVSERMNAATVGGAAAASSFDRSQSLRSMARKLAPLAPAYAGYFTAIFEDNE